MWLVDRGAITNEQADRLDEIYAHRHELTHELGKYIVDVEIEPDMELFADAVEILRCILRFWTGIEIAVGTFDEYPDIDVDDVTPGTLALLQTCIAAFADGLGSATGP